MENINSYDELKQKLGQNELETLISNEYFFDSNSIFNFFEDTELKIQNLKHHRNLLILIFVLI